MADKPKTPSSADLAHTFKALQGVFNDGLKTDPRAQQTVNALLALLKDKYGSK